MVMDTEVLARSSYAAAPSQTVIEFEDGMLRLASDSPRRGWIRRLMPMDWEHNLTIGSRESARKAS